MSSASKHAIFADSAGLKALLDAQVAAIRRAPESARHTGRAGGRLAYGLACDVALEDRSMRVDLPGAEGGTATGPHPGQLMRASLAACLLMGCRLWAARLEVPLDTLAIEIACDYDARGQLGLEPGVPVGWSRLQIELTLGGSAPEAMLRAVAAIACRLSPMLALLSSDVERVVNVRVLGGSGVDA